MRLRGLKTEWYDNLSAEERDKVKLCIDLLIALVCVIVIVAGFLVAG